LLLERAPRLSIIERSRRACGASLRRDGSEQGNAVNNFSKNLALWVIIGLLLIALFNLFQSPSSRGPQTSLAFSDFLNEVQAGRIGDVTIQGQQIAGHFSDGRPFSTYAPYDPNLVDRLAGSGVRIQAMPLDDNMPSLLGVLVSWFPMLLLIGVWIFFMRQMQSGGGKAMGFGKSRARLLTEKHGRVTFQDVAGIDEAKEELQEIVEFLKNPQKFQQVGGRIPKGCLLVGPPGTGKTLLARAIAGEANVPFFTISGSDFVEMFVGVGASRVRDMFEQAKKHAPCIVFIDEIDAVGRHRGAGLGGGNDEREQTLNQLLVEMDGFEANEGVILIAATNRPDVLDPALLRPGRFDRQVVVPNPDVLGREKILNVHIKKVRIGPDVDTRVIARGTPGFSGADLANIVNEAALLAARHGKRLVTMSDFEAAKDKVMMGAERRSMVMTEEEKRLTAYHEAGHAIVGHLSPASDPIHKATIIPRGRALGMVMRLPVGDRISVSREKLMADIAVAMGGRVAEELIFGHEKVTAGASSDIEQATKIARHMVTQWGMSDKLGPVGYAENTQEVFLGHAITQSKNLSEATAQQIDSEIRRLVEEGYGKAREVLTAKLDMLHSVAGALLERETLSGEDIGHLMRGEPLPELKSPADSPRAAGSSGGKRGSVPTAGPSVGDGEPPHAAPQPGT
jgi:cell division protease FtsH